MYSITHFAEHKSAIAFDFCTFSERNKCDFAQPNDSQRLLLCAFSLLHRTKHMQKRHQQRILQPHTADDHVNEGIFVHSTNGAR